LNDEDPSDEISNAAPGVGIIVRTDYSDEKAWNEFCDKLKEAQDELFSESPETPNDTEMGVEGQESEDDDEDEDEDADDNEQPEGSSSQPPILFHTLSPPSPSSRTYLSTTITSSLAALRLLNDVSLRPTPLPAIGSGIKRLKPGNRLIDHDGWQEIYVGKTIWIYDGKSNQDGCAKLVSQKSAEAPYGTATGDTWRARASHIPELQANIASGAITIDFGGMDRWDYNERQANLQYAVQSIQ